MAQEQDDIPDSNRMRILFLVQFFDGPCDPGSDRWYALARQMARRGHEVEVVTSPVNYKEARIKHRLLDAEHFDSGGHMSVRYVYTFADIRGSYLRRYWYFLTFFFSAGLKASRLRRPDVIYAVSTPLSVGFLGSLLSKYWGSRLFFEVTDVWPDAAIEVGVLRSRALIFIAKIIERLTYTQATKILCLTEGIRKNIEAKGIPGEKIDVVTNGVDLSLFKERASFVDARESLRVAWGASEKLVCMYIGAHGAYNALHTIIDAAICLRDDDRIVFVFVGEGDEKAGLQRRASEAELRNVRFLGLVPRSETPALLSGADCFLLPILKGAFYEMNLPNKFFDYLASGAPVFVSGDCEAGRIVEAAQVGELLPAEDGAALVAALVRFVDSDKVVRNTIGRSARAVVNERYSRDTVFRPLLDLLERPS
jgi:glycosyltransferase involved in cell wall biosynthesis